MPVISFSHEDFCSLLGRSVPRELLLERVPYLGAEVSPVAGDDPDLLSFEFFPDRPDLYSVEGIARAMRAFLGFQPGLRRYSTRPSGLSFTVDPSVLKIRPEFGTALVRHVKLSDQAVRSMMDLQEKLHLTIGRNRRKLSVGLHDLARLTPPFTYKTVAPDEVRFVPLQGTEPLTPAEILQRNEKGRAYAHLLAGASRYPLIVDAKGTVLSFPPIINGTATIVTPETTDILVDCTGLDRVAVEAATHIVTTALAERGGAVESLTLIRGKERELWPQLEPRAWTLEAKFARTWTGLELTPAEMAERLRRMGYDAKPSRDGVELEAPPYRADLLHEIDLAEDLVIGHGYEHLGRRLPARATVGQPAGSAALHARLQETLVGLGYLEAHTLTLSNPLDQYEALGMERPKGAVEVRNPVSEKHMLVRTSLLPSLLGLLRRNTHRDYPQQLFEIGEVLFGLENRTRLGAVSCHAKAGFTEAKSVAEAILRGLGQPFRLRPSSHPAFVPGRCAEVLLGSTAVGEFGEFHPRTLTAFGLSHPAIGLELQLEPLGALLKPGEAWTVPAASSS